MPEDEVIPDDYIRYFARFLDELTGRFEGRLYRYITPAESPYWVAFNGFHLGRSHMKKVSMTLSPVLYVWALSTWRLRYGWLELTGDFYYWAKAVPYTYEVDPLTKDPTYPYEFELAIYAEDYERKVEMEQPWLSGERLQDHVVVPVKDVSMSRLLPEALEGGLNEKDYYKLKVLPGYIHGRVYYRSPYRMLARRLLVQQLALVTILKFDSKMRVATGYAWDRYWEGKAKIAYPPDYEKAMRLYWSRGFYTNYDPSDIEHTCTFTYVPLEVCWELSDEIFDEIKVIYGFFDVNIRYTGKMRPVAVESIEEVTVSRHALELFNAFPQLFRAPAEAEHFLKWWHGSYGDAVRYLREFIENERLYRRMWLRLDPEVTEG